MIERGADLSRYPLLEGDDPPWQIWQKTAEEIAWQSRPPTIDDTVGLLAAAEEGLGFALARWTIVARSLHRARRKWQAGRRCPTGLLIISCARKNT